MNSGQFEKSEGSSHYEEYGSSVFRFKIYRNNESFANLFACRDYCDLSSCPCRHMNITTPASSTLCSKICANPEDYSLQKKEYCRALKRSPSHFNILFIIVSTIAVLSLVDAVLLLSPLSFLSPSYIFLFGKTDQQQDTDNLGTQVEMNTLSGRTDQQQNTE